MTIMGILRTFALLAASLGLTAEHAELSQVHTVYLLPMGNGFDQYLANRLTQLGPYRVVTDPKLADAVFTDRLGKVFEVRFEELFPKPEVPEPAKDEKNAEAKNEKNAEKTEEATSKQPAEQDDRVIPPSSFGRGKGTVFLVDRKSRRVVWSAFDNPKAMAPEVLDSTAERLVKQLKRDLAAK